MANFHNFTFFENLSIYLANIFVTKFQKSKLWYVHFLYLWMLIVMAYNLFSKIRIFWKLLKMLDKRLCEKVSTFIILSMCRHRIVVPYNTISGSEMAQTMGNFHNLMIFENLSICLAKISVTKFPKSKIWDVQFSMLIVMTYCHIQLYLVEKWPVVVYDGLS